MAPTATFAQDLPTAPYLPLDLATTAAQAALEACAAGGHNVSVAMVARDGATKALLKADMSGPHIGSSAEGKAFIAAVLGRDAGELADFIAANLQNDGLRDMTPALSSRPAACLSAPATPW